MGFWNTLVVLLIFLLIMLVCGFFLWRSGQLKMWLNEHLFPFDMGLWVACVYRAKDVVPFRKLPESAGSPLPVGEAPYGAFLSAGAWVFCLAKWLIF